MGQSAAETVREIEDTRDRLEQDIHELQQRIPAPARLAKRVGLMAAGGGVAGGVLMFVLKRRRKRKQAEKLAQSMIAAAPIPISTVINVLPEEWAERLSASIEEGRWKPWAAGLAGVWVAFRLAELRQLRRMNRAIAVPR